MASLLQFINRVRTLLDAPEIQGVLVEGTDPDDDERCVLATALGVTVGASAAPGAPEARMVMRFDDRLVARRIGVVMQLPWEAEHAEVALPIAVCDVAVSAHFGVLETDELGYLEGWWVPVDPPATGWKLWLPTDHILDGRAWCHDEAADWTEHQRGGPTRRSVYEGLRQTAGRLV